MRSQHAEILKVLSLRAVLLTATTTVVGTVVVAVAVRANAERAMMPLTTAELIAQVPRYTVIGLVVIGVLASTSEYTSRQISRSLTCVPGRGTFLLTKAVAVALAAAVTSLAALGAAHVTLSPAVTWDSLRVLLLASAHLTMMSLISAAIGMVLRQLVGTLATTMVLLVVAPPVVVTFTRWGLWLPSEAGATAFRPTAPDDPTLAVAAATVLAWTALTWGLAAVRLHRRDA